MTSRLYLAFDLAINAHSGQLDKCGQHYIFHVFRVMNACGPNETAMIVAVLHDVWEDHPETPWPDWLTFGEVKAIDRLIKHQGTPYGRYIHGLADHPVCRQVKIADIYDNLWIDRLLALDGATVARLVRKYVGALVILGVTT